MRMYPEDIKTLFPQVPVGTSVNVVDQPVKAGWIGDDLYIEVSPTQDQAKAIEEDGVLNTYEISKEDMALINRKAGARKAEVNWERVRQAVKDHSGYPVAITGKSGADFKSAENMNNKYGVPSNKKEDLKSDKKSSDVIAQKRVEKTTKAEKSAERVNVYRTNSNEQMTTSTNIKLRTYNN